MGRQWRRAAKSASNISQMFYLYVLFVFVNRFVQYDASNSRSAKRKGGLFGPFVGEN